MNRLPYLVAVALGLAGGALGLAGLAGHAFTLAVPWAVPLGGLELSMDRLAGFFVALTGLASVPVSIYAIGYAADHPGDGDGAGRPGHGVASGGFPYLAFIGSMSLVPLAANVMTFAIAWEGMALASYFLVVEAGDREATHAGWVYAVMAHAGLACLLGGMLLLATWTGGVRFEDWRGADLTAPARTLVFVLLALGFASKAGVIPLHVWLPLAHPAAPSHVSALMSGVMIKLGVYGLMRVTLEWLAPAPTSWGLAILLVGAVSAVVGVLYALVEHDLKRLLAFHSIENVGIILLGLGAGLVFDAHGLGPLAVLGPRRRALSHGEPRRVQGAPLPRAGAVVRATGTRNMEEMGGLIRRMPWTAAAFLLGAAAISALPPLNGFVSEWLTFQALLQSLAIPHAGIGLVFVTGMAGLALTGGLAMACFVKAFGITFLAMPRSDAAARAVEAPATMRAGMVLFAAACVALGLAPTVVVPVLGAVAGNLVGHPSPLAFGDWLRLDVPEGLASLSTFTVAAALVLAGLVPLVVLRATGRVRGRVTETWGCGRMLQTARMEYTATAFASPFRRIFDFLYRPVLALEVDAHPDSRFFIETIRYAHETRAVVEDWLYRPLARGLQAVTERARALQSGSTPAYLAYILAALVLVLVLG